MTGGHSSCSKISATVTGIFIKATGPETPLLRRSKWLGRSIHIHGMVTAHFPPTDAHFISAAKEEEGLAEGTCTKWRCSLILPGVMRPTSVIQSIRLTMTTLLLFTL